MASQPIEIYTGFLPTSKTVIYTVPAAKVVFIGNIQGHNSNAADQTIIFWVSRGGVEIRLKYIQSLPFLFSFEWGYGLVLNAGDTIAAIASNASAVGVLISGAQL